MTNKQLREYLGHDGSECRVTISRQGVVKRYGSPDPFERSMDFWHYMGVRDDYKLEFYYKVEESTPEEIAEYWKSTAPVVDT